MHSYGSKLYWIQWDLLLSRQTYDCIVSNWKLKRTQTIRDPSLSLWVASRFCASRRRSMQDHFLTHFSPHQPPAFPSKLLLRLRGPSGTGYGLVWEPTERGDLLTMGHFLQAKLYVEKYWHPIFSYSPHPNHSRGPPTFWNSCGCASACMQGGKFPLYRFCSACVKSGYNPLILIHHVSIASLLESLKIFHIC